MFEFLSTRRDIKEIKTSISKLDKNVANIHQKLFIGEDSFQSRIIVTESKAKKAIDRTVAMWTVICFAILGIGSVLGYQMYRIDCLGHTFSNFLKETAILLPF